MSKAPESLIDRLPAPLADAPAGDVFATAAKAAAGPLRAVPPRAAAGTDGDDGPGDGGPGRPDGDLAVATRPKSKRPSMYKVLILNDDYTPMEFVVLVLERFFGLGRERAVEIMLTVHRRGVAVVGVYSFEIAETKVTQVMEFAQQHQHPLQCTMEKE